MPESGSGEKGPSLFGRVKRLFTAAGGEELPNSAADTIPNAGAAQRLDEANRTFVSPMGVRTTPPTSEGLARAQEAVSSTSTPPSTPQNPQGK